MVKKRKPMKKPMKRITINNRPQKIIKRIAERRGVKVRTMVETTGNRQHRKEKLMIKIMPKRSLRSLRMLPNPKPQRSLRNQEKQKRKNKLIRQGKQKNPQVRILRIRRHWALMTKPKSPKQSH